MNKWKSTLRKSWSEHIGVADIFKQLRIIIIAVFFQVHFTESWCFFIPHIILVSEFVNSWFLTSNKDVFTL